MEEGVRCGAYLVRDLPEEQTVLACLSIPVLFDIVRISLLP